MSELQYIFDRLYQISGLAEMTWSQIAQFILIILGVFIFELLVVGWQRSSLRKIYKFDKSTRIDLYVWLTELFGLFGILSFLFSVGICYYLAGQIQKSIDLQLIKLIENGYFQFTIIFILSDLKEYIKHYFFHRIKPLWEIHAFHHSAENFNILTTFRFHYLQSSLGTFFDIIPFILLGVPIQTIFAVGVLRSIHGLLVHSNIQHDWGFIGKYILVSPAAHRIHHSVKEEHFNKNLGGTFIFWDHLFGTYHPAEENVVLGIPNNNFNKKGFLHDLYFPIIRMIKSSRNLFQKN
jgi:sterol desaturase/sphingolipid hydroxylase (fatty acid hydroxylase superfamily)